MVEIWHNPRCSKSRTALQALQQAAEGRGDTVQVRRYLDDAPTAEEIRTALDRLSLEPWEIARSAETRDEGIELPREPSARDAWITALADHPRVLQRPLVFTDTRAVLARDEESLREILG